MQVTHSYKEHIYHLFPPHLKTNWWMIWHRKLKLLLISRNGNQGRAVCQICMIPRSLDHYPAPHYSDVIMSATASQIIWVLIVYSTVWSGADRRKHQSSASQAFATVRGIHQWPVNSPHKGSVMRNIFPFHDVILKIGNIDIGGECSSMKCEVSAPP